MCVRSVVLPLVAALMAVAMANPVAARTISCQEAEQLRGGCQIKYKKTFWMCGQSQGNCSGSTCDPEAEHPCTDPDHILDMELVEKCYQDDAGTLECVDAKCGYDCPCVCILDTGPPARYYCANEIHSKCGSQNVDYKKPKDGQ